MIAVRETSHRHFRQRESHHERSKADRKRVELERVKRINQSLTNLHLARRVATSGRASADLEEASAIEFRLAREGNAVTWGQVLVANVVPIARAVRSFLVQPTLTRDIAVLWLMWMAVSGTCPVQGAAEYMGQQGLDRSGAGGAALDEGDAPNSCGHTASFAWRALFELCSAFGNVGLTLGSTSGEAGVSFSYDLSVWGRTLVLVTAVYGRVRGFPHTVEWKLSGGSIVEKANPHFYLTRNVDPRQGTRSGSDQSNSSSSGPERVEWLLRRLPTALKGRAGKQRPETSCASHSVEPASESIEATPTTAEVIPKGHVASWQRHPLARIATRGVS